MFRETGIQDAFEPNTRAKVPLSDDTGLAGPALGSATNPAHVVAERSVPFAQITGAHPAQYDDSEEESPSDV